MTYEDYQRAGIVVDLAEQSDWSPRAMLINGTRFVVELRPFKISAFDDAMLDGYFHSDYVNHLSMGAMLDENNIDDWSEAESSNAALKELTRLYLIGEEKTLCLTFKNWTHGAEIPFPKEVRCSVGGGSPEGNDLPTEGWRVEWEDGNKQSVHEGCVFGVEASLFDFMQSVKAERKIRGTDGVIEVAGATGDDSEGVGAVTYPLTIGKLKVLDETWKVVSFGKHRRVELSGQVILILKAMYDLGAVSSETAKLKKEILAQAGIQSGIAISKPFTGGGKGNNIFADLYDYCVKNGLEKFGTARTYYLDT